MDKSRVPHRQLPPNRTLGASLSSRDSRPSCPWLLRPKEHASPSSVNASEWKEPHEICVTRRPSKQPPSTRCNAQRRTGNRTNSEFRPAQRVALTPGGTDR